MPPSHAQALVSRDKKLVKETIPVPEPGKHQLLVKISYAAQNPTDVGGLDQTYYDDGAVLGCDFAGTVDLVGPEVNQAVEGTLIAGVLWGGPVEGLGAWSEYTLADGQFSFPVPDNISAAQAATVPLAAGTAALALFSKDSLNIDKQTCAGETILIWGGSSSVGQYAIQLATIYGLIPITTSSSQHHEHVKQLGARHVFDYRDPEVVKKTKQVAPNLRYIFDTIGKEGTSATASQALREEGGTLCTVRPGKGRTQDVTSRTHVKDVFLWTMYNKEIPFGPITFPARPHDQELVVEFFKRLPGWLADGKFKPNIPKIYANGLDNIETGYQEHRDATEAVKTYDYRNLL
ncbi:hypothetical protein HJFPF1_09807 [Paramyrothecium foliicola]|nr:hypothetical protein HJFPF1_09807 [Paramyrothecium foliicola]